MRFETASAAYRRGNPPPRRPQADAVTTAAAAADADSRRGDRSAGPRSGPAPAKRCRVSPLRGPAGSLFTTP